MPLLNVSNHCLLLDNLELFENNFDMLIVSNLSSDTYALDEWCYVIENVKIHISDPVKT